MYITFTKNFVSYFMVEEKFNSISMVFEFHYYYFITNQDQEYIQKYFIHLNYFKLIKMVNLY